MPWLLNGNFLPNGLVFPQQLNESVSLNFPRYMLIDRNTQFLGFFFFCLVQFTNKLYRINRVIWDILNRLEHNVSALVSVLLVSLQVMCAQHMLFDIVHYIFCYCSALRFSSAQFFLSYFSFIFPIFRCTVDFVVLRSPMLMLLLIRFAWFSFSISSSLSLSSSLFSCFCTRLYFTEIISYSINENYMDTDKRDDTQNGIVEFDYLEIHTLSLEVVKRWTIFIRCSLLLLLLLLLLLQRNGFRFNYYMCN